MGRMVLPWFGGSSAVWVTCMLFFQAVLLLGYLYAHGIVTWLGPRGHRWVHLSLLGVSSLVLPLAVGAQWKPLDGADPTVRILWLLACCVGPPFFALSATSPLLQAWFARERSAVSPYRLFALSNLGSMAALLTYPVLIEPAFTLRQQSLAWSGGYLMFTSACAVLAWRAGNAPSREPRTHAPGAVAAPTIALWILLAFCPSALMLAVTTHLTQDVA